MRFRPLPTILLLLAALAGGDRLTAQGTKGVIPHGQRQPPGPALPPAEAIKKMQVPDGFSVELVAAEPDLVNPVAMTFDERGRIWVTESVEYPRRSAGPGKDRVKILEDTDGDGKVDKVTIFADGLNIPSGIAVGHGGVWVANSPDILFYKIGPDGKAAGKPEVVVTGFGRSDTHELPNSLTWGPDGWLYGLNGVFNPSHVKQNGKEFKFTCALFRIHPRTKEFQVFCEGTSNPWGVTFDPEGSAFVSACVIDHLWHLTETGYYHRQGGPYPAYTWPIGSIVKHRHQQAAYCGIHYFDSDAYPAEYRGKLYMGNIHGNCINCDELGRDGSTYFGKPRPDFLTANDAWFMPVAQKTGPDGCMYILDWYDRYHCYQDANRDPAGIDRLHGRLYRVRYKNTLRAPRFDLAKETDDQLVARLASPNLFFRDLARRILAERNEPATRTKLEGMVRRVAPARSMRLEPLWALLAMGPLDAAFHLELLANDDPGVRAWAVRAAGAARVVAPAICAKVGALANDPAPDVQLQVAIAARKIGGTDAIELLTRVLAACGEDKLIPPIVWQNLLPLLEEHADRFLAIAAQKDVLRTPGFRQILPRAVERILASARFEPGNLAGMLAALAESGQRSDCARCLATLAAKVQTGELAGARLDALRAKLKGPLHAIMSKGDDASTEAVLLAASLRDPEGIAAAFAVVNARKHAEPARVRAMRALVAAGEGARLLKGAAVVFNDRAGSVKFRSELLVTLGGIHDSAVAGVVLAAYPKMEPELQPRAIDLLTQRLDWAGPLLRAVQATNVPASALNVNQVKKLLAFRDSGLTKGVAAVWGTLRADRNPERESVVAQMRDLIRKTPGSPKAGVLVFKKVCAQCHKIYGEGVDVGPDITANGRSDFDQLLSNVFDPSLVIGAGYQATTVVTTDGQVATGLVVEDSPQRVVLKVQGGELKTIARGNVDEINVSKVSLMPEGMERQLQPQEIADLFAFLTLDRAPDDPKARRIPGTPR